MQIWYPYSLHVDTILERFHINTESNTVSTVFGRRSPTQAPQTAAAATAEQEGRLFVQPVAGARPPGVSTRPAHPSVRVGSVGGADLFVRAGCAVATAAWPRAGRSNGNQHPTAPAPSAGRRGRLHGWESPMASQQTMGAVSRR